MASPFESMPSPLPVGEATYNIFEDDVALLEVFETFKKESFEYRWVFEREWQRDLFYVGGRQWITYHPTRREWIDKRLHKWIPKPVTNVLFETTQSIRTTLGSINNEVAVRPVGNSTEAVTAANVADEMSPLIYDEHLMSQVMRESDFWQIVCGSTLLQISWDRSKHNQKFIGHEQCAVCGFVGDPKTIVDSGNMCPNCGSTEFVPAMGPDGQQTGQWISFGRGKTVARSPFEYAFPASYTRFDDLPGIIVMRWREKAWFEANYPDIVRHITWEKTPQDRSLQIYKSLALTNDIGTGTNFYSFSSGGIAATEGVTEYELWLKPTTKFPKGLVLRVLGDRSPMVFRMPEEGTPGPFPYVDVEDQPIFPFAYAQYEHVGGRLYGRSALTPLIQKQDQLNQIDSLAQLIIQRMANPVWVIPEGAGIDKFSGEPGFVMKWNPLQVGGVNAKPERIQGSEVPASFQAYREQITKDIENLAGTYDILKGQKPSGVEAFSALQLLVERSQSRFTSVFQARGEMFRRWFEVAIELERQFGPDERVMAVTNGGQSYAYRHFQNAQLQGRISVKIEDGSNMPKTALGKRAAIEHASQLGLIDPLDPDQKYVLLSNLGLSELSPSLDIHVQAALQMQDEFEQWMMSPVGPPPLVYKEWMDAQIHWLERVKWLNGDKMREAMKMNPIIEEIVTSHLLELQFVMTPPVPVGPDGQPIEPQGAALASANSNQNSAAISSLPKGNKQMGPNVGPA